MNYLLVNLWLTYRNTVVMSHSSCHILIYCGHVQMVWWTNEQAVAIYLNIVVICKLIRRTNGQTVLVMYLAI
jgi:hypothetical protein